MHLTLKPHRLNKGGQHYAALNEAGEVVATSRQPFYAAARALQELGYDDEVVLTASHAGSAGIAMRSTIGVAAMWSVTEGERTGLVRGIYHEAPFAAQRERSKTSNMNADGIDLPPDDEGAS